MAEERKYWLSPRRGLPPPTGRLAGAVGPSGAGLRDVPWEDGGGFGALPPPRFLQSREQGLRALESAAQAARWVEGARSEAGLAHGPGSATPAPWPPYAVQVPRMPPIPPALPEDAYGVGPPPAVRQVPIRPLPVATPVAATSYRASAPAPAPAVPGGPASGFARAREAPLGSQAGASPDLMAFWERQTSGLTSWRGGGSSPETTAVPEVPVGLRAPFVVSTPLRPPPSMGETYAEQEARRRWAQQIRQGLDVQTG